MLRARRCLGAMLSHTHASASLVRALDDKGVRSAVRAGPDRTLQLSALWQEAANATRRESGRCCSTTATARTLSAFRPHKDVNIQVPGRSSPLQAVCAQALRCLLSLAMVAALFARKQPMGFSLP